MPACSLDTCPLRGSPGSRPPEISTVMDHPMGDQPRMNEDDTSRLDPAAWLESRRSALRAKCSKQQAAVRRPAFPRFVPEAPESAGIASSSPPPAAKPATTPQKPPVVVADWQQSMGCSAPRLSPPPPSMSSESPALHLDRRLSISPMSPPASHLNLSARDTLQLPFSSGGNEQTRSAPASPASLSGIDHDDSNLMLDEDSASDFQPVSDPPRRRGLQAQGRPKRKVGRPIAFQGDPDDPELTETERRRIKRRIANRESARRVRKKRAESLDDMQAKKDVLHQAHLRLRAHAHHATREQAKLQGRLHATRTEWAAASQANQNMVNELRKLRMQLAPGPLGPHSLPGLGGSPLDARSPFAAAAALQPGQGQGGSISSTGTSYPQTASPTSEPSMPSMELLDLPPAPPGSNPAALLQEAWRTGSGPADVNWSDQQELQLDVADLLRAQSRDLQLAARP